MAGRAVTRSPRLGLGWVGLGGRVGAESWGTLMFLKGSECGSLSLFSSCNVEDSIGMRNISDDSRFAVLSALKDVYSQGHCLWRDNTLFSLFGGIIHYFPL